MDNQNQNEQNREGQGSFQQGQEQRESQSNQGIPTSVGGNRAYENSGQQQNTNTESHVQRPESGMRDDADSRVRDIDNEGEEIDDEGEFNNNSNWTREEGLSDEERRESEEEDLNGRHSGDSSVL